MRKGVTTLVLRSAAAVVIALVPKIAFAEGAVPVPDELMIKTTQVLIKEIIEKSFPELDEKNIKVKTFRGQKSFLKARFSFARYLTFRSLRTTIFINPLVYEQNSPAEGLRAILAHELAHALFYDQKNRFQLLGLICLANRGFNAKFERRTDLVAIERGYGKGLILFREWLYKNVRKEDLPEKRRNYFTPEEIEVLISARESRPEIFSVFKNKTPRNLDEVRKIAGP